jgi:HD-like signal output (HDOD) protein
MIRDGDGKEPVAPPPDLERILGSMQVPTLPQAASRLLQMLRNDNLAPTELARVITGDPGIAARILRVVNSADVGLAQQVGDVRLAVSLLGVNRIQALVVGLSVADALKGRSKVLDHETFWCAALQRGAFAEVLASKIAPGQEGEAFTGGLLQDMAQAILVEQREEYPPVLRRAAALHRELHELETEMLGWTHAHAGAWLARSWGLPDSLVSAIGLHHSGIDELRTLEVTRTAVAAVAASAHLPYAAPFCGELGLPLDTYPAICKQTDHICRGLSGFFGVRKPRRLPLPAESGADEEPPAKRAL